MGGVFRQRRRNDSHPSKEDRLFLTDHRRRSGGRRFDNLVQLLGQGRRGKDSKGKNESAHHGNSPIC